MAVQTAIRRAGALLRPLLHPQWLRALLGLQGAPARVARKIPTHAILPPLQLLRNGLLVLERHVSHS